MAKKKKRRVNKKNSAAGKRKTGIMDFFRSERVHFVMGVIIAFAGIFGLMAMVSFFFTGAADQSIINNRSFWELINDKTVHVENWTSTGGAILSERLINGGFGIFSLLIPLFAIYLGLLLMGVTGVSLAKVFFLTAFALIGGSIASAFVLGKLFPKSHIIWGGSHGNQIEMMLENTIGWPGVILVILLFILVFMVVVRRTSVRQIQQSILNNTPKFQSLVPEKEIEFSIEEDESDIDTGEEESQEKEKHSFFKKIFKKRERPDDLSGIEMMSHETTIAADAGQGNEKTLIANFETSMNVVNEAPLKKDFEVIVPKEESTIIDKTTDVTSSKNTPEMPNENPQITEMEDYDPKKDLSDYKAPSLDLLKVYAPTGKDVDMQEQTENKDKIIRTLHNYGIEITSIRATVGPTITLYEIVPQAGVRISRIKNLEDDIALSLSALGIRIIAPMPGKGTIGIEVPNKDPQIVSMQSVIASKKFQECTYDLPVALGKTITNEVFIFDLTKMPHLLVAGATGQGKSVGLNAIITSLLYKKHPSEMKMVLVDPKMVEFNIYQTIERHYLAKLPDEEKAIITDVSKVTKTLNSLTKEMDDRYELLMRAHVRTIKEYNEKFVKRRLNPNNGHRYLPYIVVVIDEFGDLIMTAGKEIEMPIARIAQKARAVGIHMVIATQRPTTNIITGTIKANFPARMAFRVTSQIDSRTILDMNGANQLIGRGDMLFSQGSNLIRIQCAFVDTPEVEEIAQYIGSQRGYEAAFALPEVASSEDENRESVDINDRDPLFDEAARLIVVHQQGSTSLIQRKFSIGYNRAGRLMDQLEAAGIVGPVQGSKPREVYISDEYSLEKLLDSLK
jgi:S-DNA-T family DNA segregation ATPase FtsK/SpoIIIE